jgi:hypothetical protein
MINITLFLFLEYLFIIIGPIIRSQGGWHVNFPGGTPKSLAFDSIQLRAVDLLHLAIPYPTGTTFTIYAWSRV